MSLGRFLIIFLVLMPIILLGYQPTTTVSSGTITVSSGTVSVSNFPAVQVVSGALSINTSGLATEAKQDTGNTTLSTINGKITTVNTGAVSGTVSLNGTQPVSATIGNLVTTSGTVSFNGVQPVSATITNTVPVTGSLGRSWNLSSATDTVSGSISLNGTQPVSATIGNTVSVTGTFWQATQPVSIASTVPVSSTGTVPVSATISNQLNILDPDIVASGTITTQNLVPAGTATANSAVLSGTLNGKACAMVQVTGTYTGALSLQFTVDNSTWVTNTGTTSLLNVNTGTYGSTIASAATGIYKVIISGAQQMRITGLAAMTGTATVTIRATDGSCNSQQETNKPVSLNQVGGVTIVAGNGVTGTGSQRVTIASDNTPFPIKIDQTTVGSTNGFSPVPSATSTAGLTNSNNNNVPKVAVKATAGRLYGACFYSNNTVSQWIQIFDSATQPAANTAPTLSPLTIGSGQTVCIDFGLFGKVMSSGIYMANSTSATAYVNGTSNTWFEVRYQ